MNHVHHSIKGGAVSIYLPDDRSAINVMATEPHHVAEFKKLVARAMNTWDDAPEWAKKLDSMLSSVPEPVGRLIDKPK